MKHAILAAAAALMLSGCQQSIDQQMQAMCAEQEANDPASWATTKSVCAKAEHLSDAQKKTIIDAYADLQRARAAVTQ